ncbi:uncharacterized protein si:ch211-12e13.12 [Cololabis saira]|uniref:uncharacterized protein si:ch211-12e13.12 n=1 Tax=Cololabis saira TaxID=129043 RepID=UPI002AD364DC|nr:uncharacterized protein si:ch211-12e13.12 [Cololabis saira]
MKKRGITAASPAGGSSVQLHYDQKMAFHVYPGNGHVIENSSYIREEQFTSPAGTHHMFSVPDTIPNNHEQEYNIIDDRGSRDSTWMMYSSSQAYSGPEDDSTDPHETLTETSTLTFGDSYMNERSVESHSLHGVEMIHLKEFVLIDDDEDGDMSLREKTVTDLSAGDGKAADLVCGRMFSTSSGSLSESKEESLVHEAPPPEEKEETEYEKKRCCFCMLL